jgi:hypothetical protein
MIAKMHFAENDKEVEDETIGSFIDWANGHTYYVQLIFNPRECILL